MLVVKQKNSTCDHAADRSSSLHLCSTLGHHSPNLAPVMGKSGYDKVFCCWMWWRHIIGSDCAGPRPGPGSPGGCIAPVLMDVARPLRRTPAGRSGAGGDTETSYSTRLLSTGGPQYLLLTDIRFVPNSSSLVYI